MLVSSQSQAYLHSFMTTLSFSNEPSFHKHGLANYQLNLAARFLIPVTPHASFLLLPHPPTHPLGAAVILFMPPLESNWRKSLVVTEKFNPWI